MRDLAAFNFDGATLRVVTIDGEPWFVASDVCDALAIANSRDAMARLDDDEKGVGSTDTLGGTQQVGIVNESGLYSLILGSRKPEAKRFKKWVTAEVLPTIRKTGRYETAPAGPRLPDFTDPVAAARAWADEVEAKQRLAIENQQQAGQLAAAAPKVAFADAVLGTEAELGLRDVAKALKRPERRLRSALKAKGVLLSNNAPAAIYVAKGYLLERLFRRERNDGSVQVEVSTKVTPKGVEFIRRFAERHNDLLTAPRKGNPAQPGLI